MNEQKIEPHKVTKPIQLLAAWLVGLVFTNASFLMSAIQMGQDSWERGALVIAAIVNVPLFLLALFILQTRFRAELQEDTFYAEYLSKKTSAVIRVDKDASQDARIVEVTRRLEHISAEIKSKSSSIGGAAAAVQLKNPDWTNWPVGLNKLHPRYDELRDALKSAEIPLAIIFGEDLDPPNRWIVSMSHQLPLEHKVHLLRTILPYGIDGIQFWTPLKEADEEEDVYIGSYGGDSYARVTSDLAQLLNKHVEQGDLNRYMQRYRVSR